MGDVSSEPTMEEILSSIKRVIEESESAPAAARSRRAARTTSARDAERDLDRDIDEVLELHERVPFPAADALPPREVVRPEPPIAADAPAPRAPELRTPGPRPAPRSESILSANAAEASRGPLEALSRLIVKPDVAGSDTLEGMVREMLRPMLREWLDAQLPQIVETMVAREIARISDRGA
ncbi:DUF2497 domain-containing protein [Sphingomonas donggukensis]|uniref:DUF2497 domain-containing protein n=1 Tax=Sphingomonas donggukensis TaxID=2949093 RepID=A0ABY4TW90_9SPHN|nr:DUF2497 domain-containing protein [Sphingomonas donggukensis]URW76679.1 DUF2497 domain-containing protein [Sphingomonas donggukensis]